MATGNTPKRTAKQIIAILGIILLAALYIVTLLVALFAPDLSGRLFAVCLAATILVPILLWAFIWIYDNRPGKRGTEDEDPSDK